MATVGAEHSVATKSKSIGVQRIDDNDGLEGCEKGTKRVNSHLSRKYQGGHIDSRFYQFCPVAYYVWISREPG